MRDYVYSDLYFDAHLDKQMKIEVVGTGITIDNSMIELDAFELDESLCSESELTFGCCESNSVKFTVRNMHGSIKGKTLKITETIDGNTDAPFPYGVYKVYSDVPTADRTKREITAYDAMYDIINADVKSWYAGLQFPMTLRQFRDSFFAYLGITQKEVTLVNDSMTVNKTLVATQTDSESTITEESSISGKMVITAICEINGVFGNIDRDGDFEYVELKEIISPLYPANDLYPADDLFPRDPNTISMEGHYITFDYEDYQSKAITQLEIRSSTENAGVTVGIYGNNYVINGNFLVADKKENELTVIAANVLSIIKKASYTPIKSSQIAGNPCIEIGDPVRFNTSREIVESYVLQRILTGIQNKRDSFTSLGTEKHTAKINSIQDMVSSVESRTNKLERTADRTISELEDLSNNTNSRFEQTADQMMLKVSKGDVSSELSLESGQVKITGNRLVVESDNFNLTEDGNVDMTGGVHATSFECGVEGFDYKVKAGIQGFTTFSRNPYGSIGFISNLGDEYSDSSSWGGIFADQIIFHNSIFNSTAKLVFSGTQLNLDGTLGVNHPISGDITGNAATADNALNADKSSYADAAGNADYASNADSAGSASYAEYAGKADYADNAGVAEKCNNETTNSHTANCFITKELTIYKVPTGSSRRFKNDIMPVTDSMLDPHRLYRLPVRQFEYKPSFYNLPDGTEMPTVIGIIAEDVDEIYPCACEYDEDTGEIINWLERYMIPPMLALIQEQHNDIESLKQENLALRNRLSILEQRMEEIENVINNKIN